MAGRPLVLACLSRSYAGLAADELSDSLAGGSECLRIFGLSLEVSLPLELKRFYMPYDARLETLGVPGTRVDFAQRALADFAAHVLPLAPAGLDAQRAVVRTRMNEARSPARPRPQRRAEDHVIRAHIEQAIRTIGPKSSDVLAHLRHVSNVSCEQRRFVGLFRVVRSGMGL